MKYFKDADGEVFAFAADGSDDQWIADNRPDLIPMTETETKSHLDANAPRLSCPRFRGNEKLDLFTQAEQLAVVTATMSDPVVKLMYDRLLSAAYLTYEDPETEAGLALLVGKGLLTPERKAEIVSAMQPK